MWHFRLCIVFNMKKIIDSFQLWDWERRRRKTVIKRKSNLLMVWRDSFAVRIQSNHIQFHWEVIVFISQLYLFRICVFLCTISFIDFIVSLGCALCFLMQFISMELNGLAWNSFNYHHNGKRMWRTSQLDSLALNWHHQIYPSHFKSIKL